MQVRSTLISVSLLIWSLAANPPTILHEVAIERNAYSLIYDGQHKQPRWVHEQIFSSRIDGKADRGKYDFKEDALIPALIRATKDDYLRSGFDRGHMCPAGDAKFSETAMEETFFLSNISPQYPQLNRGCWAQLEKHIRNLAAKHDAIHVFTGPLFLSRLEADGKRYVKYEVIGKTEIAVPTHYFKIVFNQSNQHIESYIVPNEPIAKNESLESFKTTLEKVERAAGFVLKNAPLSQGSEQVSGERN